MAPLKRKYRTVYLVTAALMVALIGGPKRLSTQIRGIGDGFFVPLYFVVLGAHLDVAGLLRDPAMLALGAALAALNVAIHLAAAALLRLSPAFALAATAQLGVPAAVASLGLAEHVLPAVVATAIVVAALLSLAICTFGVERIVQATAAPPAPVPAGAEPASK